MRLLAAALLLAAPAVAQIGATAAEQAAIVQASARGQLIYAYDQAAWHGTDDMLAKLPDAAARIGGWVVVGSAAAPTAIFFDKAGTSAVYTARFADGRLAEGKVLGAGDDRHLGPDTLRLIAARKAALATIGSDRAVFACADKPFNTVVLPPEAPGGPVSVYVMTPQTSNATIPFGGHFRIEVGADGRPAPVRAFTRGCLTVPRGSGVKGARNEVVFVTHSLDPTPTEIHVFTSLALRRPVVVGIVPASRMWIVTGARIEGPQPLPKK